MREIREKLSEKYWKHPEILKKEMQEIREKYHLNIPELTHIKYHPVLSLIGLQTHSKKENVRIGWPISSKTLTENP